MTEPWVGQLIAFLLGLVGNFIASTIYDKYKAGRSVRAEALRRYEAEWAARLASTDLRVKTDAVHNILFRVLRWYLLGNVMFGVAGLGWIADVFKVYNLSNAVAAISSLVAVVMFGIALSWIKRYLKYTKQEVQA